MNQAAAAFAAGLVSFATPCVLPLVPAYLSAIGASSTDPSRALRAAAPFVAGFSAVFITLDHTDAPDLVIADISRIDAVEVADTYLEIPILGYTNHTDTAGLRAAHAAGFDQVVVKSALVERARELVEELTPSP